MKTLERMFGELDSGDLNEAFLEYEEWIKTGVLRKDGVIRKIHKAFETANNTEFHIHAIPEPLLYEMVKRYRKHIGE